MSRFVFYVSTRREGLDPEIRDKLYFGKITECILCGGEPYRVPGFAFNPKLDQELNKRIGCINPDTYRFGFYGLCNTCSKLNVAEDMASKSLNKMLLDTEKLEFIDLDVGAEKSVKLEEPPEPEPALVPARPQPPPNMDWMSDWTKYDKVKQKFRLPSELSEDAGRFYASLIYSTIAGTHDDPDGNAVAYLSSLVAYAEYLYIKLNRPRWLVDTQMARILGSFRYDGVLLDEVVFPYDCYTLIFQPNFIVHNRPLKWIRIFRLKSDLACDIVKRWCHNLPDPNTMNSGWHSQMKRTLLVQTCSGDDPKDCLPIPIPVDKLTDCEKLIPPGDLGEFAKFCIKVAISSALYYRCRPELVKEYALPRNCRYTFHGGREIIKRVSPPYMPEVKIVGSGPSISTGSTKRPHFRGWVFRTLRAECYRRNPDGTFRTVMVAPVAIHPDQMTGS